MVNTWEGICHTLLPFAPLLTAAGSIHHFLISVTLTKAA